jgi:hypothetical protein
MRLKIYAALCLATACSAAFGEDLDDLEKKSRDTCQVVAKELNESKGVGIDLKSISIHATWRAACAERPPTGPGNVTALCEGKRIGAKGGGGVFFWQKSQRGKLNSGYFVCGGTV